MPKAKVNTANGPVDIVTTADEAEVLQKQKEAAAPTGEGFAPTPGSVRAEQRAKQAAMLEEARDKLDNVGLRSVNIREMLNNRELMRGLEGDGLAVANPQPGYNYGWFAAFDFQARKADKYVFVSGNDQECREDAVDFRPGWHDDETADELTINERCRDLGARKRNDLTLMRIRLDHHYQVKLRDLALRLQQQQQVDRELLVSAHEAGYKVWPLEGADIAHIRAHKNIRPRRAPKDVQELDRGLRQGTL